ncbi:hypothetical protein Tco_0169109 [Tanacetum coccineum]
MPASSGYSPDSDSDSEPTKYDSSDEDLLETIEDLDLLLPPLPPVLPLLPPLPSSLPSDRDQEGAHRTFEIGESSTAHVLLVTSESVDHTVPLLAARLIRHKALIDEVRDHVREGLLVIDKSIETFQDRLTFVEHQIIELLDSRDVNQLEIEELQSQAQDAETRL